MVLRAIQTGRFSQRRDHARERLRGSVFHGDQPELAAELPRRRRPLKSKIEEILAEPKYVKMAELAGLA
jgi:hypothetical protein